MAALRLIERIAHVSGMTAAEARVARYFEVSYRDLPFATSDSIARHAGVSKATVVRAVQRLGYESLLALKEEMRDALYNNSESPVLKAAQLRHPRSIPLLLKKYRKREAENLDSTLEQLDVDEVQGLCEELIRARRVLIYGHRFSYGLAFNLGLHLAQILPDARTVSGEAGTLADAFSACTPQDHVIIVAHRRIGNDKTVLARYLRERQVPYSLVTDLREDEADSFITGARYVLRSISNSVGAFNSYSASHSLVQAVALVLQAHAPSAIDRLATAEVALQRLHAFRSGRG
jgi:DNA-binding MurR/RpiR family transcriptional regulator